MKFILEKPMSPHSAFYVSHDMTGLGVFWTDNPKHAKPFSQESAEAKRGELGMDVVVTFAHHSNPTKG